MAGLEHYSNKFLVEIVTPQKIMCSEEVDMSTIPGSAGEFGVLSHHIGLVTTLNPGIIRLYNSDKIVKEIFVSGGFVEVAHQKCVVLTENALYLDDIDFRSSEEKYKALQAEVLKLPEFDDKRLKLDREIKVLRAMLEATGKFHQHIV